MTRTKRPRKTSSIKKGCHQSLSYATNDSNLQQQSDDLRNLFSKSYKSTSHLLKGIELFYDEKQEACNKLYESAIENVKLVFKEAIQNLPETYLNTNICNYFNETVLNIGEEKLNTRGQIARPSRTVQSDTLTSEFKRPKTLKVKSRKRSMSAPPPKATPVNDRFMTPTQSLQKLTLMSVITPKVAETPMCVIRRPEHGEIAFAASGSPLLVGRVSLEDVPTVSVPLQDGRIFSILPEPGAGFPCLPELSEETKGYLKTLRQHLELLAPNSP